MDPETSPSAESYEVLSFLQKLEKRFDALQKDVRELKEKEARRSASEPEAESSHKDGGVTTDTATKRTEQSEHATPAALGDENVRSHSRTSTSTVYPQLGRPHVRFRGGTNGLLQDGPFQRLGG